ncbi:hypothetical protein Q5424_13715 [Conexibacter sp. JD483]|uniref:hypothetical protein n=1 Tax=unclassified Conexibacter TaxID=2627773 RepID=UPI0027259051|nr:MULTISPECIES: hypothetical protein [unclassified Conexibacter]MDO8188268.1 hypothetical protein [Conexibacter sp. CPCC 205706]MDO8197377.1 hypothetical protein [Conexibacter sp. CPCC 205762]MDR9370153.1 hypothetical protein [Conexibacter sp. JD483]
MPHRPLLATTVIAALALAAGDASAAYTLGTSPDAALPDSPRAGCAPAPACSVAQERLANEPLRVTLPGVVVGWRAHGLGGQVRLRRVGGGATAPAALPSGTAGSVAQSAQLPVAAGDLLAFDLLDGAQLSREPDPFQLGAYAISTWAPPLADGETRTPSSSFEGYLYAQATIEPDADGDGLGDETQDPDHGQPPVRTGGDGVAGDTPPGGGGGTPDGDGGRGGVSTPRLTPIPKGGPALRLPAKARAGADGAVALQLANPYAAALTGSVTLKQGRARLAGTRLSLAAGGSRTLRLRLGAAARRALAGGATLRLTLTTTLKAKGGKARTTTRALTVLSSTAVDGTYRASDGQVMVVRGGVVTTFSGDITLWCTRAKVQKRVAYFMGSDDPDPLVGGDGSFAWEATKGYGVVKLKFDGRVNGRTASGKLVVEDRSPLLGTGRFEFDYCFAGKKWTLRR